MSDERSIPGRVAAFETVVRMAIEEAASEDGYGYRHSTDIETPDVVRRVEQDVSNRTVLRALKDAAELGWLVDKRQGWDAGPRAEEFQPVEDDQTPPV